MAVAFGATFILLPLTLKAPRVARQSLPALVYFAAIGFGYIIVELVLLVKLTLLLGHPTRSLTVTLFGLLLFSGLGALLSGRLKLEFWSEGMAACLLGVAFLAATVRASSCRSWFLTR